MVTSDQNLGGAGGQQQFGNNTTLGPHGTHETALPVEHGMQGTHHEHGLHGTHEHGMHGTHEHGVQGTHEHKDHHYGRDAALGGAAAGAVYEGHKHAGHNHHDRAATGTTGMGTGGGMMGTGGGGMGGGLGSGMPAGAGAGTGAGMGAAEQVALADKTDIAEADNNFPGTNPHPMHSALGGGGRSMPGLE